MNRRATLDELAEFAFRMALCLGFGYCLGYLSGPVFVWLGWLR